MRKFISTLLILTTLVANFTWAADTHTEAWFGHGAVCAAGWTLDDEGAGNTGACDHCCHGFAHIVGFAEKTGFVFLAVRHAELTPPTRHFRSFSQLPLTPPPTI